MKFANAKSKPKHSSNNIRIALDLGTVLLHLYVKSVTKSGKMRINSRSTWNRNIPYKNVFAAKPGLKAKTILMNTLEQNIKRFRFVIYNIPVITMV